MLIVPPNVKIYLYSTATDMRKSFNTLSVIITNIIGLNPLDGSMYVFYNKYNNKIKILHWHQNGFWLHYKNLVKGKLVIPKINETTCIHSTELYSLLESAASIVVDNDTKLF